MKNFKLASNRGFNSLERLNVHLRRTRIQLWLGAILLSLGMNISYASSNAANDHVGLISKQALLTEHPKFKANYTSFEPTEKDIALIKALSGKQVIVLFGTWCHDSVREVPRLLRLLDQAQVEPESLELVGMSRRKDDPLGYSEKFGLKYTPTVIVLDAGTEIARMIERPTTSLAQDLAEQIDVKQR